MQVEATDKRHASETKIAQERLRKGDIVYLVFEHGMLRIAKVQITKRFGSEKLNSSTLKVTFTMPNSMRGDRRITRYFHFDDDTWDFYYD